MQPALVGGAWRAREFLTALALFLAALVPRALSGRFLTIDEGYHWIARVALFEQALAERNFAATNLIGHPGVTTLWLGTLGSWLERLLASMGLAPTQDADLHRALLRLPVGVVSALCVAVAYPLLRRLLGRPVALGAAMLWAGEPFLVAHAQLLHLDSLLASFMSISILALLCATQAQDGTLRRGPFVLSAVAGGLALLTKSPSIALLPIVALILGWGVLADARGPQRGRLLARAALQTLAWCGLAAALWFALWPAAWVDPASAVGRVVFQAQADGGSPHGWGNFFLGRPTDDPGPLFYPLALALRLAPWTLLGILALLSWALLAFHRAGLGGLGALLREHRALVCLALFALLFLAMMSVPPKKFDRYALPVIPTLDILAAAGIAGTLRGLAARVAMRPWMVSAGWAVAAVVLAADLAWYHPYELAYFDPLLGGGWVAQGLIPIGWGEGYELAGDYIAQQPNGADRPVAALYEPVLQPYAPGGAAPMDWAFEPGRVDYAVLYIDQIQREYKPYLITPLRNGARPIHTVVIHGIPYAYIYQIAPPAGTPLAADFGDAIRLRGYSIDGSAVRATGALTVTLQWEGRGVPERDYSLFVHIFDAAGRKVGQVDVGAGDPRWPTSGWTAGRYITQVQRVPLPANLPPGQYSITLGVYNPADFRRLALDPASPHSPSDGADALLLGPFSLP
jgi:hypothetical protein